MKAFSLQTLMGWALTGGCVRRGGLSAGYYLCALRAEGRRGRRVAGDGNGWGRAAPAAAGVLIGRSRAKVAR